MKKRVLSILLACSLLTGCSMTQTEGTSPVLSVSDVTVANTANTENTLVEIVPCPVDCECWKIPRYEEDLFQLCNRDKPTTTADIREYSDAYIDYLLGEYFPNKLEMLKYLNTYYTSAEALKETFANSFLSFGVRHYLSEWDSILPFANAYLYSAGLFPDTKYTAYVYLDDYAIPKICGLDLTIDDVDKYPFENGKRPWVTKATTKRDSVVVNYIIDNIHTEIETLQALGFAFEYGCIYTPADMPVESSVEYTILGYTLNYTDFYTEVANAGNSCTVGLGQTADEICERLRGNYTEEIVGELFIGANDYELASMRGTPYVSYVFMLMQLEALRNAYMGTNQFKYEYKEYLCWAGFEYYNSEMLEWFLTGETKMLFHLGMRQ